MSHFYLLAFEFNTIYTIMTRIEDSINGVVAIYRVQNERIPVSLYRTLIVVLFFVGVTCSLNTPVVAQDESNLEFSEDFDSFLDGLDDLPDATISDDVSDEGASQWEMLKLVWQEDRCEAMRLLSAELFGHLKNHKGKYLSGTVLTVVLVAYLLSRRTGESQNS
jgi:hypothetical protein